MQIKKIALVGLGSIGRRHLRLLKEIRQDIDVTLVRSGKGQSWPEEKLANRITTNFDDLVDLQVQAAIISSPSIEHVRQAHKLAQVGVHLLVEKPLSHSLAGVEGLTKEVGNKGIAGLVGYVFHYDPAALKFNKLLKSGLLGEFLHARVECSSYLPGWRPDQDYRKTVSASVELGGGVLNELSHELDYSNWFFGIPSTVQALLSNSGTLCINVADQADLILVNGKSRPVSIHLDFNSRQPKRNCVAQTTKGQLTWNAIEKQVSWQPFDGEPEVHEFDFDRDYIYREQLYHFFDCIENGARPAVSIADGAKVVTLIDAIYRANESGSRVTIQ